MVTGLQLKCVSDVAGIRCMGVWSVVLTDDGDGLMSRRRRHDTSRVEVSFRLAFVFSDSTPVSRLFCATRRTLRRAGWCRFEI